jgi:hypothetical protein
MTQRAPAGDDPLKTLTKVLVAGTAPALLAGALGAAPVSDNAPASTQPATQSSTRPQTTQLAQSNAPLVIPDGTSPQNPGPQMAPNQMLLNRQPAMEQEPMVVFGLRG